MEMPKVTQCDVTQCAYNDQKMCHALAITIGHGAHPHCDTYCLAASAKGGDQSTLAGVGACKVMECRYNDHLECQASSIRVGHLIDDIDCQTFSAR